MLDHIARKLGQKLECRRMLKMQEQKRPQALCPICRKATEQKWRPFCSKHCADVGLGRWINGAYSMPADEPPAGEET